MTHDFPPWLSDLLAAPPVSGEGVHNYLFRVARHLHVHLPAVEIVALLRSRVRTCGRHVPDSEIVAAVQNSLACAWKPRGASVALTRGAPKWPRINLEQAEAICAEGYGLADLWEASPIRIEDCEQHTEGIIDRLFPGNPLLCCGRSQSDFDTRPREQWCGELAKLQFVVPSPMCGIEGVTKEGKPSRHSLSNTGTRRFVVCEFDTGEVDSHAALLLHLAAYAPMVCALHSGGKSMHGWFYCAGQPEEKVLKFFRYAVSLGADPATWTRSQFVRMPDGTRDNGKRQTVFFFHPQLLEDQP